MIYFNKLIDICINRQERKKVVDNYDNRSIKYYLLPHQSNMLRGVIYD